MEDNVPEPVVVGSISLAVTTNISDAPEYLNHPGLIPDGPVEQNRIISSPVPTIALLTPEHVVSPQPVQKSSPTGRSWNLRSTNHPTPRYATLQLLLSSKFTDIFLLQ